MQKGWEEVASYPGPHAERGREPGDTWQDSRMHVHSQHNCVSDYIPYLDAFEITRKVAVDDGYRSRKCLPRSDQRLVLKARTAVYLTATLFRG